MWKDLGLLGQTMRGEPIGGAYELPTFSADLDEAGEQRAREHCLTIAHAVVAAGAPWNGRVFYPSDGGRRVLLRALTFDDFYSSIQ